MARSRKLSYRNSTLIEAEQPGRKLSYQSPTLETQHIDSIHQGAVVETPTKMISHHTSEYFSMSHSSEYESDDA